MGVRLAATLLIINFYFQYPSGTRPDLSGINPGSGTTDVESPVTRPNTEATGSETRATLIESRQIRPESRGTDIDRGDTVAERRATLEIKIVYW